MTRCAKSILEISDWHPASMQAKLQAAIEGGERVILPAENEQDVRHLPDYMRDRVEIRYVSDIKEVLDIALVR